MRKLRTVHLEKYRNDVKCNNCNTWYSISSVEGYKHDYIKPDPSFGVTTECGKCKHTSHWNLEAAPLPLRCDASGNIIQD